MSLTKSLLDLAKKVKSSDLIEWAVTELVHFREGIVAAPVDDANSYSDSFIRLREFWFNIIHKKLDDYHFQNGETKLNTWELRPKANFWWMIYCAAPEYYRPFYDHHCSSKQRQEQMVNLLSDILQELSITKEV